MAQRMAEEAAAGNHSFSHFGPAANLFEELEALFGDYGSDGGGRIRRYLHDDEEAAEYGQPAGTFTPWEDVPDGSDVLFYEGLHGAVACNGIDVARHVDLLIGVVPVINLEWIQKIHRDKSTRGYSTEAVTDAILRRMPDYVQYICPQFTRTHVNFQRVPVVDTSDPFIARFIPTLDESFLVIRFRNPRAEPGDGPSAAPRRGRTRRRGRPSWPHDVHRGAPTGELDGSRHAPDDARGVLPRIPSEGQGTGRAPLGLRDRHVSLQPRVRSLRRAGQGRPVRSRTLSGVARACEASQGARDHLKPRRPPLARFTP